MAVVNINGTILNNSKENSISLITLSGKQRLAFCNNYSILKELVIDKVSIVSNVRFYQIN